jgi:hypothetical protein
MAYPICGTGGCVKFKNLIEKKPDLPTGYSVPDFGVDEGESMLFVSETGLNRILRIVSHPSGNT